MRKLKLRGSQVFTQVGPWQRESETYFNCAPWKQLCAGKQETKELTADGVVLQKLLTLSEPPFLPVLVTLKDRNKLFLFLWYWA
jgi:hypothetical protein